MGGTYGEREAGVVLEEERSILKEVVELEGRDVAAPKRDLPGPGSSRRVIGHGVMLSPGRSGQQ